METSLIGKALDFGSNDCGFESRVSSIFYNNAHNYVINHIIFNAQKKNLNFEILYTKKNLRIIFFLKKMGLINNFFCFLNKNRFKIKMTTSYYKNVTVFKKIKLLSTPSRFFFISYNALKLLHCRLASSVCVLSTSKGVMSHSEALKCKTGGKLIMIINL